MRFSRRCLAPALVVLAFVLAQSSYGAAQLAAGAKTSAQPTSTNPQQRACQITFDPVLVTDSPVAGISEPFTLTSFRLSVSYDPTLVTAVNVDYVSPFTGPLGQSPTPVIANGVATLDVFGTSRTGYDPKTAGLDVNIFSIDYTLLDGVSLDTPIPFTIFAAPTTGDGGDFLQGVNASGDVLRFFNGINKDPVIQPTDINYTFNEMTAIAAPLPSSVTAGLALFGLCGIGYVLRRRAGTATSAV